MPAQKSNLAGCDSIVTLNLTILNSTSTTISDTACDSYVSPSGNYTYTGSGTYSDTIPNMAGCDSIISIDLIVNNSSLDSIVVSACGSYTSPSGNSTYTTSGTYLDIMQNVSDCDSIIQISLTIITVDIAVWVSTSTLSSNNSGASYQWIDCNNGNASISGENNQTFNATSSGLYAVIIADSGCIDTSDCYELKLTSVLENANPAIQIYPNPAADEIYVTGLENSDHSISIYDAAGKLILKHQLEKKRQILNIKSLGPGIYILEIRDSSGLLARRRFSKS